VWKHSFYTGWAQGERLEQELGCCAGKLEELLAAGLVEASEEGWRLTETGRAEISVVLAGGVFDILHPGHVFFLESARRLGDALCAVVARDETVRDRKRIPVVPERQRLEMLRALKPVDVALVGAEDMREVIRRVVPDVIALGPDQRHTEEEIQEMCRALKLECRVVRLGRYTSCPLPSTRSIIERVLELFGTS